MESNSNFQYWLRIKVDYPKSDARVIANSYNHVPLILNTGHQCLILCTQHRTPHGWPGMVYVLIIYDVCGERLGRKWD